MAEVLESLFGSKAKLRILRYFLLNPEKEYTVAEIAKKNILKTIEARKEITKLKRINLVTERSKKKSKVYKVNLDFPYYFELKGLIVKSNAFPECKSFKKINGIGDVKLVLTSGVFLNYPKSKVDLLLVINDLNRSKLNTFIKNIEAEVGKEIRYVLINTEELKYRLDMLDRFLLDFFQDPHEEVINELPKLSRFIKNIKR